MQFSLLAGGGDPLGAAAPQQRSGRGGGGGASTSSSASSGSGASASGGLDVRDWPGQAAAVLGGAGASGASKYKSLALHAGGGSALCVLHLLYDCDCSALPLPPSGRMCETTWIDR